ncbi:MAG: o-succinylbenzoate synthase [Porphyromonas sp.]|nr:o-succinylbenzoate synthase [Porphyromonas sp.]
MELTIRKEKLRFKQPAKTSRGVYLSKDVFYIERTTPEGKEIIGECAPLQDLSPDFSEDYHNTLSKLLDEVKDDSWSPSEEWKRYPSILFGIETALRHIKAGSFAHTDTPFSREEKGIPINGLIWMGSYDEMLDRIEGKLREGFRCLKLKIGAIAFDSEVELLLRIRNRFLPQDLEIRLDANGAFSFPESLEKLNILSRYKIHSIEQPIAAGEPEQMSKIVRDTPIPVALDEELIGIYKTQQKRDLLETIRPHYIILKPTLHGSFYGCDEWIKLAQEMDIPWWATSALESNIGLNAIAHWVSSHSVERPQGLGTGELFINNISTPLYRKGSEIWYDRSWH